MFVSSPILKQRVFNFDFKYYQVFGGVSAPCKDIKAAMKRTRSTVTNQPSKCKFCKQKPEDIIFYNGHPNNSSEESISLTNDKLLIFTGKEENLPERDSRPLHKLTSYTVYDQKGHLTPFDNGLVEDNVVLHLSGYLKPICSEDPSAEEGISTHDIGPINAWYITGFDGGDKAFVGILTNYSEYILMEPSAEYRPVVKSFLDKIPLLKLVIEFLLDFGWENPAYEELLFHVQNASFDEDSLLQNACFICKHVHSFDNAAPDEDPLMAISCMKTLVKLSGVTLQKNYNRCHLQGRTSSGRGLDRKATTTKLVRSIFENFFPNQIDNKGEMKKKKRCGICENCQRPDCGKCSNCQNMPKFGGSGKRKQACKLRKCPNMDLEDSEESADSDIEEESNNNEDVKNFFSCKQLPKQIEWPQEPILIREEKRFYASVIVGEVYVKPGNFVMLNPDSVDKSLIIGKVISIFSKHNQPTCHIQMFCRGNNTILGETADPQELFLVDICEDCPLTSIVKKTQVMYRTVPENWSELGDTQTLEVDSKNVFFFNKKFDTETGRFTHCVEEEIELRADGVCACCRKRSEQRKFESKILEEGSIIKWRGDSYTIGSSIFLNPSVYKFNSRLKHESLDTVRVDVDEEIYPEYYRKMSDVQDTTDLLQPFIIGQIEDISANQSKSNEIKIKVRIFYRPENTKIGVFLSHEKNLNLLYWTDEVITTSFENVAGKCYLIYSESSEPPDWTEKGPYRFYFHEAYNPKSFEFSEVSKNAMKAGNFGKTQNKHIIVENAPEWDKIKRPLRCMDVFAGCGGLSLGLHQAGIAETKWAIENMDKPAEAFKMNISNCRVFTADANKLLKEILSERDNITKLPVKGEVEMLVGGPPCQGFCNMNRFSERQYSYLKNSLIATFLSYCDYYRPKYFVLENVRNFGLFKNSVVLKLTLKCLLAMNYQVTFGVLQAAHYGLPQTRRRFILIAAAPGFVLPKLPEPQNVFEKKDFNLSLTVDGLRYHRGNSWTQSAPYRTVCVRDAISDLPARTSEDKMAYDGEAVSHFQRKMRLNNTVLYDHVCKELAPIVEARIGLIPLTPGSDWRDLPNICVKLKDNTITNKLEYQYCSKKQKKFDRPRAICVCGIGKKCTPMDRQLKNTLIPWCLPHTADRHNNWAGLYGRLGWDEVFKTTITNPEPMGKQGKVIHPEENRVVSVRECARSQGFPDHFRFCGGIMDKYREIGNAVPPPLGEAIGLQIRKAVAQTFKNLM